MTSTTQSDTEPLVQVYLKHPRDAYASQARIDAQWESLNYLHKPGLTAALDEYDAFAAYLSGQGIDLRYVDADDGDNLDAVYVRDASVFTDAGAVMCSMGKAARRREPDVLEAAYRRDDVTVLGRIEAPGKLEGGDVVWLDGSTLAVGECYRSNASGIDQLQALVADTVDTIVRVPLPHWQGPQSVLHLMSMISIVDDNLAVVYSPLMPVPFREQLLARGFELLEVPASEFDTLGCNVLAIGPRRCVMAAGNPRTRALLEAAGASVHEFSAHQICAAGEGGPTCLTRPTWRRA